MDLAQEIKCWHCCWKAEGASSRSASWKVSRPGQNWPPKEAATSEATTGVMLACISLCTIHSLHSSLWILAKLHNWHPDQQSRDCSQMPLNPLIIDSQTTRKWTLETSVGKITFLLASTYNQKLEIRSLFFHSLFKFHRRDIWWNLCQVRILSCKEILGRQVLAS